ncbi:ABC transporter permease [Acidisoma sp. S159]|jgi:ribose/xylose/arabinose/galactoside ABC-type transport system permease subunit|uniref:ABC transporter permease n=1 Tax=Acidisoma sp. S159 TaxID=1747225 RepID=UPI00131B09CE|nr:ABC transporter permease [Acidisoma sp. S159]
MIEIPATKGGHLPARTQLGREGIPPGRWGLVPAVRQIVSVPILPITILIYGILALTTPGFLSWTNVENLLVSMSVLAIAAIGTTVVFLIAGIDLSVGSTIALASIMGAVVTRDTGMIFLGLATAVLTGAAIGLFNGICVGILQLSPFVLTLGALLVARAVGYMVASAAAGGGATGAASVGPLPPSVLNFGRSTIAGIPTLWWIALIFVAGSALVLSRTDTGRGWYLLGSSARAALFSGLRTRWLKCLAYLVAGTLAGLAGFILMVTLGSGDATAGDNLLLQVIAATVVGGTSLFGGLGGAWRTFGGVFLIVGLTNALNFHGLASWYQEIVVGAVIVLGTALAVFVQAAQARSK